MAISGPLLKPFLRSGLNESVVTAPVSKNAHRQAQAVEQTLIDKTLTLRLVKVVLSTGTIEVPATSLTDSQAFPAPRVRRVLHHARWNIEESFKILKHRLYLEQFTGELPKSIHQNSHAKLFPANLTEALAREAMKRCQKKKPSDTFPMMCPISSIH